MNETTQLILRVSPELKRNIKQQALDENTSINQMLVDIITQKIKCKTEYFYKSKHGDIPIELNKSIPDGIVLSKNNDGSITKIDFNTEEISVLKTKNITHFVDIKKGDIEGAIDLTPDPTIPLPSVSRCEAPGTACRGEGQQYLVGFMTDEGVTKKKIYLCDIHLKKAWTEAESVEEV